MGANDEATLPWIWCSWRFYDERQDEVLYFDDEVHRRELPAVMLANWPKEHHCERLADDPSLGPEGVEEIDSFLGDVAFVVDAAGDVTAARLEGAMRELAGPLLREITLFDVFRFEDGRRSLAWRLTFQAEDRTLTDDEINAIQERVARGVSERFHITWRGE